MKSGACRHEQAVRDAAVCGRWTLSLDAHVGDCADCQEVRLVTAALRARLPPSPVLADPRLLWVSARHARRLRAEAQVSQIVTGSQIAAGAIFLGATLRFVRWSDLGALLSTELDDRTLLYGAIGLLMIAAVGASRWMSQDT